MPEIFSECHRPLKRIPRWFDLHQHCCVYAVKCAYFHFHIEKVSNKTTHKTEKNANVNGKCLTHVRCWPPAAGIAVVAAVELQPVADPRQFVAQWSRILHSPHQRRRKWCVFQPRKLRVLNSQRKCSMPNRNPCVSICLSIHMSMCPVSVLYIYSHRIP